MNNINLEKLKESTSELEKNPSSRKIHKSVKGSWVFDEGKPQFVSTLEYPGGKVVVNTELPPSIGGWGTSPDPIQLCLSGMASCFAVSFASAASSEGVKLTKLEVSAENWMDIGKVVGISTDNIIDKVQFSVNAEGASREKLEHILKLAQSRCAGVECLRRSIPLKILLNN